MISLILLGMLTAEIKDTRTYLCQLHGSMLNMFKDNMNIQITPDDIIMAITDQRDEALNKLALAEAKTKALQKALTESEATKEVKTNRAEIDTTKE